MWISNKKNKLERELANGTLEKLLAHIDQSGRITSRQQRKEWRLSCSSCVWLGVEGERGEEVFTCRRHPPTNEGFPLILLKDWCGEYLRSEVQM